MKQCLLQITPTPFAHRNIFCSNRLFQNKYERYEWIQEAIAQGITSPREIHHYAHQKDWQISAVVESVQHIVAQAWDIALVSRRRRLLAWKECSIFHS